MAQADITIVADTDRLGEAADVAVSLVSAWPRPERRPTVRTVHLSDWAEGEGLETSGVPASGVVVALPGASFGVVETCQLVDLLQRRAAPALLLVRAEIEAGRRLEGGGVLIEPAEAPAERLAAQAFALWSRQTTVRALAGEAQIARSTQGGMKGEMDRLHEELHLAASVQRAMLPGALPEMDTLAFGSLYRPAGYVSGDIYDVRRIDNRRVAFLLADAVGHGVPAALLTMIIARALRTHDDDGRSLSPAETLGALNNELCAWSQGGQRFATAAYAVVDTRTHEVTISTAGHPPPLVLGGDEMIRIDAGGPLLGVFEGALFDEETITLARGQSLLFYSDGFEVAFPESEAEARSGRVATTRYLDAFSAIGGEAAGGGAAAVARAMERLASDLDFQPGSLQQADDVTALILSATASAAERAGTDATVAA